MEDFKTDVYYKYLYFIAFTLFLVITSFLSYFLTNHINIQSIYEDIHQNAKKELHIKKKFYKNSMKVFDEETISLSENLLLEEYIKDNTPDSLKKVKSLFSSYCGGIHDMKEIIFFDTLGNVKINIAKNGDRCSSISPSFNKVPKEYLLDAKPLKKREVYRSNINLYKEKATIKKPLIPIIEISTPVYFDKKVVGVIMATYSVKDFLSTLTTSAIFDISLLNSKSDFIVYKSVENKKSFGKEFQSDSNLEEELNKEYLFSFKVEDFTFLFEAKEEYLLYIDSIKNSILGTVILSFFTVSIPVGLVLSFIPISLNKRLHKFNHKQSMLIDIIDKNIYYTDTDKEGNIKHVSKAFLEKMEYSLEEVLGKKPNVFSSHYESGVTLDTILKKVKSGERWIGEVINYNKSGEKFYFHTTVAPQINLKTGQIESFSSIKVDITDKKRVEEISITDELTGMHNRRYYKNVADNEIQRAARSSQYITFMMLDIDYFKLYNDTYGHQMGDHVLKKVAQAIKSNLKRPSDFSFRMGGEEFSVIVSGLDEEGSSLLAEKILQGIRDLNIEHSKNSACNCVTSSLGLVVVSPKHDIIDEDALYKLADNALYEAKENGRNRVYLHQKDELELF